MHTFERVANGVHIGEFDGTTWYWELIETRDELIIWSHQNRVDVDVDKLFPQGEKS